jgi:hypothetical protein
MFAQRLIAICVRNPKKKHTALVEWCKPLEEVVPIPEPRPEWEATGGKTVIDADERGPGG